MMTDIASQIRMQFVDKTIGVQVLSGGNKEALAIAKTADLDFIRLESFVFGHVGDEERMEIFNFFKTRKHFFSEIFF